MRKSERLRLLEIEFVKVQMQLELLTDIVTNLIDNIQDKTDNMDAGKWYVRKPNQKD